MLPVAAALLFLLQDPFQTEIDDAVREFEAAGDVEQALVLLSSHLLALGARASNPIARRLAVDLRDGMASAAAPAFIDALINRPEAVEPLQAAFRDAATSAAGRIELAEALLQLDDALSWRAALLAIARNPRAALPDRLHAARVLLEAGDENAPTLLQDLGAAGAAAADEPRVKVVDEAPGRPVAAGTRSAEKKKETRTTGFLTMPSILAGGVTLVLLILLAIEILRKG